MQLQEMMIWIHLAAVISCLECHFRGQVSQSFSRFVSGVGAETKMNEQLPMTEGPSSRNIHCFHHPPQLEPSPTKVAESGVCLTCRISLKSFTQRHGKKMKKEHGTLISRQRSSSSFALSRNTDLWRKQQLYT